MNSNKVLNGLLHVFLGINILLFIINGLKFTSSYILTQNRIKDITSILEQRNIMIDQALPRVFTPKKQGKLIMPESTSEGREALVKNLLSKDMKKVTISTEESSNNSKIPARAYKAENIKITFAGSQSIYSNNNLVGGELVNLRTAKKVCAKFIKQAGLNKSFRNPYIEDISTKEATILIYYPRYEGMPVFDSSIQFYIFKEGIAQAIMKVAKIESLKGIDTKRIIYPIDIILFGIEDYLEVKGAVHITDIVLGYRSLKIEGMDILEEEIIPVYKITIQGLSEPLFVNAYTNTQIK